MNTLQLTLHHMTTTSFTKLHQ